MSEVSVQRGTRRRAIYIIIVALLIVCATALTTILLVRRFSSKRVFPPLAPSFSGDSKSLPRTQIVPTLDTPMEKGKNVIWCAAFTAAWKRMQRDVAGGPIFLDGADEACTRLNAAADPAGDVPADSIYANAGWAAKGIIDTIRREMAERFTGVSVPTFEEAVPGSAVAYAYIRANVQFATPYVQASRPLQFTDSSGKTTALRGFRESPETRDQLKILYVMEWNAEEFAIDLDRKSQSVQIVLACIRPEQTLQKTLASLEAKIAAWKPGDFHRGSTLEETDTLLVPDMFWRMQHRFSDLEGRRFRGGALDGMPLVRAWQDMEFRLDRAGVRVEAKAGLIPTTAPTHFHLARPFLMYLRKRDSKESFFVMWVDNTELLQLWPKDLKLPKPQRRAK